MAKIGKFLVNWLPAVIWMSIIFYFSSRTRTVVSESYLLSFIFFKTLHVIEYAALYFLIFRGFYLSESKIPIAKKCLFALIISVIYAASDELHQTLVPTREGRIRDVFIDSLSIFMMYIYVSRNIKFLKKYL